MSKDSVSLRDVYDIVDRLEKKILPEIKQNREDIDALQATLNKAYGVMAVLSLFFSAVAGYIWNKIIGNHG